MINGSSLCAYLFRMEQKIYNIRLFGENGDTVDMMLNTAG